MALAKPRPAGPRAGVDRIVESRPAPIAAAAARTVAAGAPWRLRRFEPRAIA
jgi:hypothetical protein